jgi:hypothetical protein
MLGHPHPFLPFTLDIASLNTKRYRVSPTTAAIKIGDIVAIYLPLEIIYHTDPKAKSSKIFRELLEFVFTLPFDKPVF